MGCSNIRNEASQDNNTTQITTKDNIIVRNNYETPTRKQLYVRSLSNAKVTNDYIDARRVNMPKEFVHEPTPETTTQEDITTKEEITPKYDTSKWLFIGDSLTVGLSAVKEDTEVENSHFLCQGGLGISTIQTVFTNSPNYADKLKSGKRCYIPAEQNTLALQSHYVSDIIFNMGTNDTFTELDKFKSMYKARLAEIKETCPNATIHICILKPCDPSKSTKYIKPAQIPILNDVIRDIANEEELDFIDLYTPISEDLSYLSSDGVHMTTKGYKKVIEIIYEHLTQ